MRAIEILRTEHEQIQEGLSTLLATAERVATMTPVKPEVVERSLDFFDHFADGIHHAKEEQLLFPALERAGFPSDRGPLAVMRSEHELARALLRRMRDAARDLEFVPTARSRFVTAARQFADLMANHMGKEDGVLFEAAERLLAPSEAAALDAAFERFEAERAVLPRALRPSA
jgi:hemerythrin-like domain-containing protein